MNNLVSRMWEPNAGLPWRALKKGTIKKKSCEKCGDKNTVAHHDDYEKPLEVRWLCEPHHYEHHHGRLPLRMIL